MKFLNKIVFINSADKSLKYAEVNLDGNVHFIGTQGVGKSTLLRAILFFYNADKQKLGIPREKKTFDEYYFPFQNSYIVYEVQTDYGLFCALAFKSQGRVAFRFFDSAYDKNFFIDNEGRAFESWDKTRDAFGKDTSYTRVIHSYEEYRNILYGNNKGLSSEFRKYTLLESKQFQNIPRTITNVFLNANLSAEFVKETIIKSLNEEEIKIDLTTYSQTHLKDFETNLNDIKKWTDRNRNGENQVEKQADNVSTAYASLKYLENKKKELAAQLGWSLENVKVQQPKVKDQLAAEELKRTKAKNKLSELDTTFNKKKEKIQEQIGGYKSKLEEIKNKSSEYAAMKIETILERVSKKGSLEFEKKNLLTDKEILTSKFLEIQQRYEAQLRQLENQLKEFENGKQNEKNIAKENFLHFKDELNKQYDLLYDEIRRQHKEELEVSNALVKEKDKSITANKIKRSEIKNKRFYEKEIDSCNSEVSSLNTAILKADNAIQQATEKGKNIQKEWLLEETGIKEDLKRNIERQTELQTKLGESISAIDTKIDNHKDSLYGWLNEQVPGWEKTIGKVIDEENVLYKSGLNPKKISNGYLSFFGISIDTNEISKKVKTVADLQKEKDDFNNQIKTIQQVIADLNTKSNEELEKLRRRFQPKVKEQKEIVGTNEYQSNQSKIKLEEVGVRLSEWKTKAANEKETELKLIDDATAKLSDEKIKAEEQVQKIEGSITKQIDAKKKEKEGRVKAEQQKLNDTVAKLDSQIEAEKISIGKKETEIKNNQNKELDTKGADTKRIQEIDLRLSVIEPELIFIENNRDTVAEYNKDKRELFDKEDDFKSKKNLFEKQLETELAKHQQQQEKLIQDIGALDSEIIATKNILTGIETDLRAFENFEKTDVYQTAEYFVTNYTDENITEFTCVFLIGELNTTDNTITKRYIELQEAINKFTGNFQDNNLFRFKIKFTERAEYFEFADMLKEFIDEHKLSEYKTRVEERFAHIIRRIGIETGDLISKEGEISQVIRDINNDFVSRKFVQAIKSMELRTKESANKIFRLLVEIKSFNDENQYSLGKADLFNSNEQVNKNEKAISLLKQLIKEMAASKEKEINLSDSFELEFRIIENDNDSGWVEKLTNVGSEGTDVLVKAMINIMLLNVFKDRASKKHKDDFRLHCMMDEIGKLHPNNVKGILKFANDRNILLINSSPTSYNATDYRYTYLLAKDSKNVTSVKRLVRKIPKFETEIPTKA
ncbi:MAG: ATP-binding protein [Bacteroidetes bacterium]|nr:ATP-binding protein [Bacteroidota bacterium]